MNYKAIYKIQQISGVFHETQIGGRSVFLFFTKELVFIIITFYIYTFTADANLNQLSNSEL